MNAIEIRGLTKNFGSKQALKGLNMTVPAGAIYGFIGENGSGKSTTEKLICGLMPSSGGTIKLYGKVLKLVRMEGAASNKFKNCSLGMKQRIGIAMALLGDPALLVLDEPINGLDADGMRIMREILVDITRQYGCTVLISSHILGELEKIATHYGIIRQGKMIQELSAKDLEGRAKVFTSLRTQNMQGAFRFLCQKFPDVRAEDGTMLYFFVVILVSVFVAEDFRSGYAKNLFTIRAQKGSYVISKTVVCFIGSALMFLAYFIGAIIGGAIAGLPFDMTGFGIGGVIMSMLSKLFMVAVFVGISLLASVAAKSKTWLSVTAGLMASMLLYTMVPMITPLTAGPMNVILCLAGGVLMSIDLVW